MVECGAGGFLSTALGVVASQLTRRGRIARESVTLVAETLTGRLIDLDGDVFQFETDQGERIVFTLPEASAASDVDLPR